MEATTREIHSTLLVIDDKAQVEAAERGELFLDEKQVLITNISMTDVVRTVFTKMANEKDSAGSPVYKLSRSQRGIATKDAWGMWAKITAKMMEDFTIGNFTLAEKFSGLAGRPTLRIVAGLSRYACVQWQQGRWFTTEL